MNWKAVILSIISVLFLFNCNKEDVSNLHNIIPVMPTYFPGIDYPDDNRYSYDRWLLGKRLFYSNELSINNSINCGSCHKPELAFADHTPTSMGVEGRKGTRNVPSLSNVAFQPYFTREGEVPTLEMQILVPIQEHDEFDFNIVLIAERLNANSNMVELTEKAYGRLPDPFTITRAIANFERTIISCNSYYDLYLQGEHQLSSEELKGRDLFFSDRLACGTCHSGFDFTDYAITNNGLYLNYTDPGRFRVTNDSTDLATFKTPSLRNIELTSPYMHDGSISTLEQVIEHYNSGVKNHINKDKRLTQFSLTIAEKNQLLAFLNTLTDNAFISNLNYLDQ